MSALFDEVHVFAGVGERTGLQVDRAGARGRRAVCRSMTELASKARRLGDGYYYIASKAWPPESTSLNLTIPWVASR